MTKKKSKSRRLIIQKQRNVVLALSTAVIVGTIGFFIYASNSTPNTSATAQFPCLERKGEVWAFHAHNPLIRGVKNTCVQHLQDMLNIVHFHSNPEFRLPKTDHPLVTDGDYGGATAYRVNQFKFIWNAHAPTPDMIISGNGDSVDIRTWSGLSWICGAANPNC